MTLHGKLASRVPPSSPHPSATYFHASPIFRLPVETLSRIFEFGTYRFGDDNIDDAMSNLDSNLLNFPIRVAAVSRRFRTIAHSTPSLWTTLNFYFPRPPRYGSKSDAQPDEFVHDYARDRLCLTRSRACALDVILCYRDPLWTFTEERHYFRREHMEHILSLLEPHAWRIRRFTLICDTFAPIHASLEFFSRKGDIMRKLSILELYRCNEYVAEYPRFYPLRYAKPLALPLDRAPLKRIILAGVHVDWNHHCKSEALRYLETLDISYLSQDTRPSLEAFIDTLRASPYLRTLSVIGSGPLVLRPNTNNIATYESQSGFEGNILAGRLECILPQNLPPLSFHHLSVLKLGFYHINDAILVLSLVFNWTSSGDHPPITDLTLKDLSQPSETNFKPGSTLLTFLTGLCDSSIPDRTAQKEEAGSIKESNTPERGIGAPFTATLRHLTLECIMATEKAFTGLLNISPTLETLTLDGVSSSILSALCPSSLLSAASFDSAITSDKPDSILSFPCPRLKILTLRFLNFPTERITGYTALAKSRAAAGIPLERLVVHHRDIACGLREADVEAARKYVTDDIEISGSEEQLLDEYEEEDPFELGGRS